MANRAPAIATSSRLNPYDDPGPWGFVYVGGLLLPGVVEDVDGCDRPEEWNVQKATEKTNATTVWKGTNIADKIEITLALPNRGSFAALYGVRDVVRPKIGKKPPSLSIVNPQINWSGITRVSGRDVTSPKWVKDGGYWRSIVKLVEYNPAKPANTGPATAAAANPLAEDPNAAAQAAHDAATAKASGL